MQNRNSLSEEIKGKAKTLGFSDCAIIPARSLDEEEPRLKTWIRSGMHGEMGYMERNAEKRRDPRLLFENARSVIVVLQNYFPGETQKYPESPVLSKYAYGTDYHFVMKKKLNKLRDFIQKKVPSCKGRPFVDSAPVLERAWAREAGLGWIGKNSNLISIHHGSFFFIGELIVDIDLPFDNPDPVPDHCGKCTRCIDACPSQAIVASRIVDARKCISYQTIELKGELDKNLKDLFKNRVFGCDICQDVCPWNLKAKAHHEPEFHPHPQLLDLTWKEWHDMERSLFNELFKNSAVRRTGYKGLKRNLHFIYSKHPEPLPVDRTGQE